MRPLCWGVNVCRGNEDSLLITYKGMGENTLGDSKNPENAPNKHTKESKKEMCVVISISCLSLLFLLNHLPTHPPTLCIHATRHSRKVLSYPTEARRPVGGWKVISRTNPRWPCFVVLGGRVGGWVGGWVGGLGLTDRMVWMGGWVGGWVGGWD